MKTTKQPQHCAHVANYYLNLALEFPQTAVFLVRHYGVHAGKSFFGSGADFAKIGCREFIKSGGAV